MKKWDSRAGCNFYGRDLSNRTLLNVFDCGDQCVSNKDCTHFTFTSDSTCWMKRGRINFSKSIQTRNQNYYCGIVLNKSEEISFDSNSNKNPAFGKKYYSKTHYPRTKPQQDLTFFPCKIIYDAI